MTGNQVVSTMFDIDSFIHMARIVPIREIEMKTLDLVSTIQAARSFVFIMLYTNHKQMVAPILCLQESMIMMYYEIIPVSE